MELPQGPQVEPPPLPLSPSWRGGRRYDTGGLRADVREYYRQITDIDIGPMAREILAERIVQESDRLLQCDCPNHKSSSHRSLHILLDKQGWCCFGCGVGGDVLQLVEFVESGTVTKGQSGRMPETHRRARDFLAAKAGLPPLARFGLSPERLRETEAERELDVRVQDALTALASFYHLRLKDAPEVLEWLTSHYGIGRGDHRYAAHRVRRQRCM